MERCTQRVKSQCKWVVARLQFTILLSSTKLVALILTKRKCGHTRKTNPWDDCIIKSIISWPPTSTYKNIQAALFESHRTVSYRLVNAFQLRFCKPAWKPRLWKLKQKNVWTLEQKNNGEILCSLMNLYCSSLLCAKHYARREMVKNIPYKL